jgi:hypothetical protein
MCIHAVASAGTAPAVALPVPQLPQPIIRFKIYDLRFQIEGRCLKNYGASEEEEIILLAGFCTTI